MRSSITLSFISFFIISFVFFNTIQFAQWQKTIIDDTLMVDLLTDIEDELSHLPNDYELHQNYPNPFNPSTTIRYTIPEEVKSEKAKVKNVMLKIYDVLGREIVTLIDEKQKPGNYEVSWDAIEHPSGVYFYELVSDTFRKVQKMVLLK